MKYTNNYNLKMPEQTDYINVDDFNYNFETIDEELMDAGLSEEELVEIYTTVDSKILSSEGRTKEKLTELRDAMNESLSTSLKEVNGKIDSVISDADNKINTAVSEIDGRIDSTTNEVSGRLDVVESEVNRLSDIFSPVSPDDTSGSVGARTPIDYKAPLMPKYEKNFAFYGEVPSSRLINGTDLAAEVGLTAGYVINNDAGWLKYLYDGNIIFVSKKNIRNKLGWSDLDRAGLIYGDKTIDIKGFTYKIRLIRGIGADVQKYPKKVLQYYEGKPCHNSEWNMLFCTLSDKLPYEWFSPKNVSTRTPKLSVNYSDEELDMKRGSWCQELIGGGDSRCSRGNISDASVIYAWDKNNSADNNGWRPVLQLVK